jgi:hypothetical protein
MKVCGTYFKKEFAEFGKKFSVEISANFLLFRDK